MELHSFVPAALGGVQGGDGYYEDFMAGLDDWLRSRPPAAARGGAPYSALLLAADFGGGASPPGSPPPGARKGGLLGHVVRARAGSAKYAAPAPGTRAPAAASPPLSTYIVRAPRAPPAPGGLLGRHVVGTKLKGRGADGADSADSEAVSVLSAPRSPDDLAAEYVILDLPGKPRQAD